MPNQQNPLQSLTREDLYERVWKTPASRLSTELSVSDVAVAKRCKKLNIPRPPRGYWAKVQAGQKVKKTRLPRNPVPAPPQAQAATLKSIDKKLSLPSDDTELHPLAQAYLKALKGPQPWRDKKRVHLKKPPYPDTNVSRAEIQRVVKAFHVMLVHAEPLGINFRDSQSSYDGGHFRKSLDRLHLQIIEPLEREGKTSWHRPDEGKPIGRFKIRLESSRYESKDVKEWMETPKLPLEVILAQMLRFMHSHFRKKAQKRREAEIQRKKSEKEWEIRRQQMAIEQAKRDKEEAEQKHRDTLVGVAQQRKTDLLRAADWWHEYQSAEAFLLACERQWLNSQQDGLTPEQQDWMEWAREFVESLSPFNSGYPDPKKDGLFESNEVPLGGPYPETRDFPKPRVNDRSAPRAAQAPGSLPHPPSYTYRSIQPGSGHPQTW